MKLAFIFFKGKKLSDEKKKNVAHNFLRLSYNVKSNHLHNTVVVLRGVRFENTKNIWLQLGLICYEAH